MSIYDQINEQMKTAMRARDKERLGALRGIRTVFINERKKNNSDTVTDAQCIALLRTLAKQRKDSLQSYTAANREDLAAVERSELAVIDEFLPKLADDETTRALVAAVIAQIGATDVKQLGRVMGMLMKEHRGTIDGGLAKKIAAELLA
ncbi:MAG: GatB/YqeY domain-containing protein [Myxococcota bacterium]|nr:GatB/YqeY domain-containing protein [Myxococcota bacterium]